MKRLTQEEKAQVISLIQKGEEYEQIQRKLGRPISKSTYNRIKGSAKNSTSVEESRNSNFIDDTETKLRRYFGITFDDLVVNNSNNVRELRDLKIIYNEYEVYFGTISENIRFSLQEKYQALISRDADGVKVICDAIHFVSRRSKNKIHAWKFESDSNRTAEEKILGNIIGIVKKVLNGEVNGPVSDPQKKNVTIVEKILDMNLSSNAQEKLMRMLVKYNSLDIIEASLDVKKTYDAQSAFLQEVEARLNCKEDKAVNDNDD